MRTLSPIWSSASACFSPRLSWTSESSHYPSFPFPSWNFVRMYLEADVFTHHIVLARPSHCGEGGHSSAPANIIIISWLTPPSSFSFPACNALYVDKDLLELIICVSALWFPFPVMVGFLCFGFQPKRHTIQTSSSSSITFHLLILSFGSCIFNFHDLSFLQAAHFVAIWSYFWVWFLLASLWGHLLESFLGHCALIPPWLSPLLHPR